MDDRILISRIAFVKGEEFEGKCRYDNQECLYTCVNRDFTHAGGDPGDEGGMRLFRLSLAETGKVLGHYTKEFKK